MKIYRVSDKEFMPYGRLINLDTEEIISTAEKIPMPENGSVYTASEKVFEELEVTDTIREEYYAEMPVQVGYCCGHSDRLNAVEWHKCSEINIAVTDFILLLGKVEDVDNGKYNSENIKAFKVCKGEAIEVYSTTLHFCPIETNDDGFGCVVALLKGTNLPLEREHKDKIIFRKNKWILAHEENKELIDRGVVSGVYGPNHRP